MNIIYGDDNSVTINQNIGTLNISGGRIIVDDQDITDICGRNGEQRIGVWFRITEAVTEDEDPTMEEK